MIRIAVVVIIVATGVPAVADEIPWHLQPMDTWNAGECYRSPHTGDGGGGRVLMQPTAFEKGDVVTVKSRPGMQFMVLGEAIWRASPTTKLYYWYYPAKDVTDGTSDGTDKDNWHLTQHEMQLVRGEERKKPGERTEYVDDFIPAETPPFKPGDLFVHTACFWEHNVFRVSRVERGPKDWMVYETGSPNGPVASYYCRPISIDDVSADDYDAILSRERLLTARQDAKRSQSDDPLAVLKAENAELRARIKALEARPKKRKKS